MVLTRKILSPNDLRTWTASVAYQEIVGFIQTISRNLTSRPIRPGLSTSEALESVVNLLKRLQEGIDLFPAEEQPQRFGNKAYRSWFNWLKENGLEFCRSLLFTKNGIDHSTVPNVPFEELLAEVSGYLIESFGNATRIDYGTGHELAFIAFLVCLFKTGVLQAPPTTGRSGSKQLNDYAGVGLVLMPVYLELVRKLQLYYRMEPAGSHGVWCLDDFQFVPFIWGSSQLIGNDQYGPSSISDREVAAREKDAHLLFSCVNYIYQVKTGPFEEHSHTLYGIGQVPHWEKVHSGLIKMYKGEVLDKFPVIQHFRFGHLLTLDRFTTPTGPGMLPRPGIGAAPPASDNKTCMPPPVVPTGPVHLSTDLTKTPATGGPAGEPN